MIQRIQTLYLLLASALVALMLFLPLADFASAEGTATLTAFAVKDAAGASLQPTLYLGILAALAAALPFVVIFLFKNRMLQFRLCVVDAVLLFGLIIMECIYYWLCSRVCDGGSVIRIAMLMPVVSLLLMWLAGRAILHDEMLVRAADRIR